LLVAFIGLALLICLARGPRETGWIGWSGGWTILREDLGSEKKASDPEAAAEGNVLQETSSGEDRDGEAERVSGGRQGGSGIVNIEK
jgi:hypothetical protein